MLLVSLFEDINGSQAYGHHTKHEDVLDILLDTHLISLLGAAQGLNLSSLSGEDT